MKYDFFTIQDIKEGELYKHILLDKTLYIMKDKELIAELTDKDIMNMLRALGIEGDFIKGFTK